VRQRDEAEFVAFAHSIADQLHRTAYLMSGDWHRAEDAAQDALVRVYAAWPRLRHRHGLRSYAHKALVSVVLDHAKRPWHREYAGGDLPDEPPASRDAAQTVDDRMFVVKTLSALPARQRACVVLRHYVDLSLEETAEVLGISVGAVKSQTSRGLAGLRAALDRPDQTRHSESKERVRR
jgi:RNA polymerase sigma-70 factor (sigma-E family)